MSHVSCRLYSSLLDIEKSHGISLEEGLAGVDVSREFLENPHNRIDWEDFRKIMRNYHRLAGSDEAFGKMQSCVSTTEGTGYLRGLFRFAVSPEMLYRIVAKFFQKLYTPVSMTFKAAPDGTFRFIMTIDNNYEDCREFISLWGPILETYPALIGLPEARVECIFSERRGEYRISPPKSQTLWARSIRLATQLFRARSTSDILQEQNEKLIESFHTIDEQSADFQRMLDTLQDGVAVIRDEKVVYANAALARLMGVEDPKNLVGGPIEKRVAAPEQQPLSEWGLRGGSSDEWREFRLPGQGEEPAIVEVSTPQDLIWGERQASMLLFRDVTEQRRAADRIAQASHREQQRIARDLHDGLGQELAAVALKAKVLENELKPTAGEKVSTLSTDLVTLAKDASARARDISHSLAPVDIAPEGLEEMLRRLLSTTARLFGFDHSFSASSLEDLKLPPEASMELYRAIQEALTNAYRHGRATHVSFNAACDNGYLKLSVEDNGQGLPEDFNGDAAEGMGLKIMRHRIASLGGHCSFEKPAREESQGLRVSFEVPLPEIREEGDINP